MKKYTSVRFTVSACILAVAVVLTVLNACNKDKGVSDTNTNTFTNSRAVITPANQSHSLTQILTVAKIQSSAGIQGKVLFLENAEVFSILDPTSLTNLQQAYSNHTKVKVTFNPWNAVVINVSTPTSQELASVSARPALTAPGITRMVNLQNMNPDDIDNAGNLGILKPESGTKAMSLTNIIPDLATAQSIFNYIARQCCKLSGPYNTDYCISFQYCEDGCYARAEKMCFIMNNTYHYATHKIFSFANAGSDVLSVLAEKWGGCCINWWFHVTMLVSIQTPGGVKAYVFDPAMFDQPVLLSSWLHAQENPACVGSSNPNVSMINVQPTAAYLPMDYSGTSFDTDPYSASTDTTLVHYSPLVTCP